MQQDILGSAFEAMDVLCENDSEGPVSATLIRRRCSTPTGKAVLYLHGYCDYFFQEGLAQRYVDHGLDFYALDLRKYGRSLREHQSPNFCQSVEEYFEEIDQAVEIIRKTDNHSVLLLNGHSTGGLIASLYSHHVREKKVIDALFLNSPFLEFNESFLSRKIILPIIDVSGAQKPTLTVPGGFSELYGAALHKDHQGEWDFNLEWKPIKGFPIFAGWVRAIHRAQEQVTKGLEPRCPVLVMHSSESSKPTDISDERIFRSDIVLDVEHIAQRSIYLGGHVTKIEIQDGIHDLVLSRKPVREKVYESLFHWLDAYLPVPGR